MTDTDPNFWWCQRHSHVESGDDLCPGRFLLGPYETHSQAQQALQSVEQRNNALDAEDDDWENGD